MRFRSWIVAFAATGLASACYENFKDPVAVTVPADYLVYTEDVVVGLDDAVHVYYAATSPDYGDFVRSSFDGGSTWTRTRLVHQDVVSSFPVDLLADVQDASYLYGCYFNAELQFRRSTDGGDSWNAQKTIVPSPDYVDDAEMAQSQVTGRILIAYAGSNDEVLYVRRSSDRGNSWGAPVVISSPGNHIRVLGLDFDDASNVVVLYSVKPLGMFPADVFVRHSSNEGSSWSLPTLMQLGVDPMDFPWGAVLGTIGTIHTTWVLDGVCRYRRSTDGGASWSASDIVMTEGLDESSYLYSMAAPPLGSPVLLAYSVVSGICVTNIYYHEHDGTSFGPRRRLNNYLDTVTDFAGIASNSMSEMIGVHSDWRWRGWCFGSGDIFASVSDPDDPDDFGCFWHEDSIPASARRGDAISFWYWVGNWSEDSGSVDAWITWHHIERPLNGNLEVRPDISLEPLEESRFIGASGYRVGDFE